MSHVVNQIAFYNMNTQPNSNAAYINYKLFNRIIIRYHSAKIKVPKRFTTVVQKLNQGSFRSHGVADCGAFFFTFLFAQKSKMKTKAAKHTSTLMNLFCKKWENKQA